MSQVGINNIRFSGSTWDQVKEASILADKLGYCSLSLGEAWGQDAFTSLAQLAAITENINIGTSIVPTYGRTPSNLAMTALSMDSMSKGRFFLGLGASGKLVIEGFHGETFHKPLSRMREYIKVLRLALNGEKLNLDGEFFKTNRFKLTFPPYRSNMPIYIASLSPASLKMTGEIADGWLPIYLVPSRMKQSLDLIEEGAKSAGRNLSDIKISPQVSIYVTNGNEEEVFNKERPHIAFYIGGMGTFYHDYMHRIGFGKESDLIREAYLNKDREKAAKLVTDEMVSCMSIIGSPAQCKQQMDEFFNAGVDEIRLVFNEDNHDHIMESINSLAPYI